MRCARLQAVLVAALTVTLQACGSGSSAPAGNGSVAFRPLWEGAGGTGGVPQETCGGGFGTEVPSEVNTARIIFRRDDGPGSCCVAVRRNGSMFPRRVVLINLTGGEGSITVDGFKTPDGVPDQGLPECATSTENPGAPCGGGQEEANFIGDPASVNVVEGLIVNVGNLCIRSRPVPPTHTPTHTPTERPTFVSTATATFTPSELATPTDTPTSNVTATPTDTPFGTPTPTPTDTPTATPTATDTATPTVSPSPTPSQVTLRIGSGTGAPGEVASFSVAIGTAGQSVDVAQNEIVLAADAPIASNANGEPDCASATGSLAGTFLPMGCVGMPPCTSARFTYARQQVPDGTVLYTCNVSISSTASPGPIDLRCQNATWANVTVQAAALCTAGTIVVQSTP